MCHLCVTHPDEIFVNFVLKHIHTVNYFVILSENEYFLIYDLHCSFTNTTLCP